MDGSCTASNEAPMKQSMLCIADLLCNVKNNIMDPLTLSDLQTRATDLANYQESYKYY